MSTDDVARVRAHYAASDRRYAARFSFDRPDVRWAWSQLTREIGADIDRALALLGTAPEVTRVLDLGCGTGRALDWLKGRGEPAARLVGVDLVASRLAEARRLGAPLLMADGARLPCRDGAFDLALALTTLSSMPSEAMRREAAAELLRVIRPGGAVICYELARKNPFNRETVALDEAALRALFAVADVRCRRVTLHPVVRRALFALGGRALAALDRLDARVDALRTHVLAVISRR